MVEVSFVYATGLKRRVFGKPRLVGNWDQNGRESSVWSELTMNEIVSHDGCPAFTAKVAFEPGEVGKHFRWGVRLDGPQEIGQWAIATEIGDAKSAERYRSFTLGPAGSGQTEIYRLTYNGWMGAQKDLGNAGSAPDLRFAVWAPNAQDVEVVFGRLDNGYIADDGDGIDSTRPAISLTKGRGGVWEGSLTGAFDAYVGVPYMFKIKNAQGQSVYRTDLHSRWQIGRGDENPRGRHYAGDIDGLDGGVSCSVVIDRDIVRTEFEPPLGIPVATESTEAFWKDEFTPSKPIPTRIEDLVIYELHVGSLGFGRSGPGTLKDAMDLVSYLDDLGVNAVELLPMSEFSGDEAWGYGNTHHFVIESSAGGRDKFKHFVRECHRHGIAVIQDVVYNHYDGDADRAEWQFDSTAPEQNIYYWYEGKPSDYPGNNAGGYLDNGSSGWLPRLWEEQVRHLFISSAAQYVDEFHIDGLRVDLTQALHRDNVLHANGHSVGAANQFGQKLLREWSRTLRMIKPDVFLIAEDHTGWDQVTAQPDKGGLGFNSTWFADFYHNLIGDADSAGGKSRLLHQAGFGDDRGVDIGQFASALYASQFNRVVYHESHDEAGNSGGSLRTSRVAVNDAPLLGATRVAAESRSRVAFGLSLLSAGNPMFYMGEEIVAQKLAKYDNVVEAKEDLHGERAGKGSSMFRFYQELMELSRQHPAVRSKHIDILHAQGNTRVIAFTRRHSGNDLLVVVSLNNAAFPDGYTIASSEDRLPSANWREVFNSDSGRYGGSDLGNFGAAIPAQYGRISVRVPARGFVVLRRE